MTSHPLHSIVACGILQGRGQTWASQAAPGGEPSPVPCSQPLALAIAGRHCQGLTRFPKGAVQTVLPCQDFLSLVFLKKQWLWNK